MLKHSCYMFICNYPVCSESLGFDPCRCNYSICDSCCDRSPCKPGDGCADVLESIALVEAALSHILNAEGEKIQKTLATTDDIDKMLCVNREVNKTIINATHLEHILYAKLSALSDCGLCCNICDKDDSCPDKCCAKAEDGL